ncbi:Uncharacterised protein [Enterobacter cloacae]|nr:Uncharacterised protein [Enterobacter cloacae]
MPGRFLTGPQDFLRHNTSVDSHAERETYAGIRGWAFLRVKRVVIGPKLWRCIYLTRNIFKQLLVHVFRKRFCNIDIARQIAFGR